MKSPSELISSILLVCFLPQVAVTDEVWPNLEYSSQIGINNGL